MLPNGFVVLFDWPKTNDVNTAGAVAVNVGVLNRFGSFDTSEFGRLSDLLLSSGVFVAPNENVGFGCSIGAGGLINTLSRTVTFFFSLKIFAVVDAAVVVVVSVTSDEATVGEPNFGDPNVGAAAPNPN